MGHRPLDKGKRHHDPHTLFFLFMTLAINIAISGTLFVRRRDVEHVPRDYSYVGNDYPTWFEFDQEPVEMVFEETVRYSMDGPIANEEWSSPIPEDHLGYVRLGPDKRVFAIAMYHEMHCINTFRKGLLNREHAEANEHHVQHCLNYLRQLFLCSADSVLEPDDFVTRNYSLERVGFTRQCRDWSKLYINMSENYGGWGEFYLFNKSKEIEGASMADSPLKV